MQELKYHFTAQFGNGYILQQPAEDKSQVDEKRSAFFDVLEYEKSTSSLIKFSLSDGSKVISVDLTDGHFEVNGIPFLMHEEKEQLSGFRLIFFRRHRHVFNISPEDTKEMAHVVTYRIGWQCTVDGKNHQRVMEIA